VVGTGLRWLLRPGSPLRIAPTASLADARWLYDFWRSSNLDRYRAGLIATARLGEPTFALYDRVAAEGVAFEMHRDGVLFAYEQVAVMEADRRQLGELAQFGYELPDPLSGEVLRDTEPALSPRIAAGYVVPQERSVRPESLVAGLARRLGEIGVPIRTGTPCLGLVTRGDRVVAAQVPGGELEADAYVVAAGVATSRLLDGIGVRVRINAGKGCALDVSLPPLALRRPVYLHDDRLAITPLDGMVRVAGMMELGAEGNAIPEGRLRTMTRAMSRAITGWPASMEGAVASTGGRPMTPDGLPVIGLVPGYANLAVASGHAMLGVTLAPATAVQLARLLVTGRVPEVLAPFDPARFARRGSGSVH
jgi:D-amino-acid dehydrogenase